MLVINVEKWDIFRDCKYNGDKPTDNQQAQGGQSALTPMILWWESG